MKLHDFLKVKQVRCVDGDATIITTGKVYDVIGVDETFIHVTDDNGEEACYWYCRFEPVLDSAENPLQDIELTPEFEAVEPITPPRFQAGQKAYCPWLNVGRLVLLESNHADHLFAETVKGKQYFNNDGTSVDVTSHAQPDLFHATQENHELLCKLMPWVNFEQPLKELVGSDLARAMLERGDRRIYGYASDNSDNDPHGYECVVRDYDVNNGFGVIMSNARYEFFNPCDLRTGEPLTESVLDE